MKRILRNTVVAILAFSLGLIITEMPSAQNVKDRKKTGASSKIVHAADLANAFAKDPKKANSDFSPKLGRPTVEIMGRVRKVAKGEALLTNADSEVGVYVSLGNEKAKLGDLINATVKTLKYDADKKIVVVESDNLKVAPEESGSVPRPPKRRPD